MRGNKKGTRVRQIRSRVPPDGKRATILDDFDGFYAIDWVLDGFSTPELADCLAAFALRFFHGMGSRIPDYRGVAIFAKAFMSIPAQQAAKTTRPLMPAAAPAVLVTRSLPNKG